MIKAKGFAVLVAGWMVGCDPGHQQSGLDGSQSIPDADPDASLSTCSPTTDNLKCEGKNVLRCACTQQGARHGTDIVGNPIYDCDAYNWIPSGVCDVVCDTTINPQTACLASTQPVPECTHDGLTCWNGNQTFCFNGYPLPTTPCPTGTQCTLVSGCGALCLSDSTTTDPRCPALPGLFNDFCADNTAYRCACGYLTGTQVCGLDPHGCVTTPVYDPSTGITGPAASCGLPP